MLQALRPSLHWAVASVAGFLGALVVLLAHGSPAASPEPNRVPIPAQLLPAISGGQNPVDPGEAPSPVLLPESPGVSPSPLPSPVRHHRGAG